MENEMHMKQYCQPTKQILWVNLPCWPWLTVPVAPCLNPAGSGIPHTLTGIPLHVGSHYQGSKLTVARSKFAT